MRIVAIIGCGIILGLGLLGFRIYKKMSILCFKPQSERYAKRIEKYTQYLREKHKAKPLSLITEDNVQLSGLLIERPQAHRVIAIFHGYRQAKEFIYSWVDLFKEDTLLLIDFRAHGKSMGDVISFGFNESKDVKAVADFLKSYSVAKSLPAYALGISMGSIALLKAVQEGAGFKAIVLDSGFSCLETQLKYSFSKKSGLPQRLFFLARIFLEWHIPHCLKTLKPYKLIEDISTPVFIIHSDSDRVVPVECAKELYDHARGQKKLWITTGPEHVHNHKVFPKEYKSKVLAFFDRVD